MPVEVRNEPIVLLIVSALILLSMLIKVGARRFFRVPPVVGYIVLGVLFRAADSRWQFVPDGGVTTLHFLAELGVAALLFQVGLTSNVRGLTDQLPRAARLWVMDVIASGGLGFTVTWIAGLGFVPAMFVAAALSATSVGVSVAVWEEGRRLKSRLGQLLVDVAELDDLSAVVLMVVVVAIAPILEDGAANVLLTAALGAVFVLLVKLVIFAALCWTFAHYLERRFTQWVSRSERPPDRILTMLGVGFGIAAIAGAIGFSVAIGALFAGLMFSRDPRAVHEKASFAPLYAVATPFFFIDIGFAVDTGLIGTSVALGFLLFIPAVLGKMVGLGVPAARELGWRQGVLLGVSMIPRAEIALLIARMGNALGPSAVPDAVYGGLVCAAGLTSLASPLVLGRLLNRWSRLPDVRP